MNVVPASINYDQLRVMSNDTFVQPKEEDGYYFAYGDISQLWKRQTKSTGRMVRISSSLLDANAKLYLNEGRNQGI